MTTGRLPTIGAGPTGGRGEHEIYWARGEAHPILGWHPAMDRRPPTQHPKPGSHVLYRANDHGPLVDAEVVRWNLDDADDPNLNCAQPWPEVRLLVTPPWPESKLDEGGHQLANAAGPRPYYVDTREARLDGTAGWLPLDHHTRAYPVVGF